MRFDPEVSTLRRERSQDRALDWGDAVDAPTFLPKDEVIEVKRIARSDSVVTSAPRPAPYRTEPASKPAPLPEPPSAPLPKARVVKSESSHAKSKSSSKSKPSQPAVAAAPVAPAPAPAPEAKPSSPELPGGNAPFVQFPGGGAAFDPLALPLPPELAPAIYNWLRRLALQAELAGADRLLRDALAELTSSLAVIIIYAGPDGFYTLGADDELPKDLQAVTAVGKARRALVATHTALVPIATPGETIAVIQLSRNARQPAYGPADYVAMAAFGREAASVMHHLVVEHLQHKSELARDKGSLYRHEALESHRKRGTEGVLADMSPRWVRRAYPMLVISILAAVAFAIFIKVPTYSSGHGIVLYDGTLVTAPASGTVDKVYVQPNDIVAKGDLIIKLSSQSQDSDLAQATTEYENAVRQYLFDPNDEQVKKSLATASAARRHAQSAVDQRLVRANVDGKITELDTDVNRPVNGGDQIAKIANRDAKAYVIAFLPGSDRPRLSVGDEVQIDLRGFNKPRERATIDEVRQNTVGANDAKRILGAIYADAVPLEPNTSYTVIVAHLESTKFHARGKDYTYSPGMVLDAEVKIESKRFLATLLPDLEHIF